MFGQGLCNAGTFLMAVAFISTYNCLARSDYNLVIALSSYSAWSYATSKNMPQPTALLITLTILISIIFDTAWLFLVWDSWGNGKTNSKMWNRMVDLHDSILVSSMVNIFLKLMALCIIQCEKKTIMERVKEKL